MAFFPNLPRNLVNFITQKCQKCTGNVTVYGWDKGHLHIPDKYLTFKWGENKFLPNWYAKQVIEGYFHNAISLNNFIFFYTHVPNLYPIFGQNQRLRVTLNNILILEK